MSNEKPTVKIDTTPQGQTAAETPPTTAPSASYSRWTWNELLGDPLTRYGVYSPPKYITNDIKLNMLYDPIIAMACGFTGAVLVKATRVIECEDENKRAFFDALFRKWEQEFILQANIAVAFGSVGLVKKWRFKSPGSDVWSGNVVPYIITGFEQCYPETSTPVFDDQRRQFQGIDTTDGRIDRHNALWLTMGKEKAFGDYYGWGRLNNAYNDWWAKMFIRDSYIVSTQKTAIPPIMISYPPGIDEKTGTDNNTLARGVGNALQAGATVTLPSNMYIIEGADGGEALSNVRRWAAEFLKPGESIKNFPALEDHHNRLIALAYLLPPQAVIDVTGGDLGGPTSSDKLTKLAETLLMQDAAAIDRHLNEYVFPDISEANFPADSPPVTVRTVGLDDANVDHMLELLKITLPENPQLFSTKGALESLNLPVNEDAEENIQQEEKEPVDEQIDAIAANAVNTDTGKVEPKGAPLPGVGDDPVDISVDDIARSVARWYKNADAEARGVLLAPTIGEND